MFRRFRKSKTIKFIGAYLALSLLGQIAFPSVAYALTGGPSLPGNNFEPIGTNEMVDPFSGDFTYNIPLGDAGYPINISYNSGVTMDQEAGPLGLGWSLTPGLITRNMRSVPDDFDGDMIKKDFNIKANKTYGISAKTSLLDELVSIPVGELGLSLNAGLGVTYNNYNGVGLDVSIEPALNASAGNGGTLTAGLGLSANSESGVGITPSVSFEKKIGETDALTGGTTTNASVGLAYNSRSGLEALTISAQKRTGVAKTEKRKKHNKHSNGGASISFSTPTYTPKIGMPLHNASISISATIGSQLFVAHGNIRLSGYFSGQFLFRNDKALPAYGYMNIHKGAAIDEAILDFNREKDGGFTKHTPNLPLTNFTYDVYSVSGQGIGGMYRPFRSDIGTLSDSKTKNISGGLDLPGIELGAGNLFKAGLNSSVNESTAQSGKWKKHNSVAQKLRFKGTNGDAFYEPYYFKQAGEKTAESDESFIAKIGGDEPVRVKLNPNTKNVPATSTFEVYAGGGEVTPSTLAITANNTRVKRQRRNQTVSVLKASEAKTFGLTKDIRSYNDFEVDQDCNVGGVTNPDYGQYKNYKSIPRTDHPNHHISEMTVLRPDGARYIYGIPAYNNTQEEASFAINGGFPNCSTGLVGYNPGEDDDIGNKNGNDNYYTKTTLPAYAHSYLLTAIISPDYVDVTGNGPSNDDQGTFTKFNYTRADPTYKWRVPYQKNQASYSEGLKSKLNSDEKGDDKASYLYGTKEIWYLHSIVTKTHIAEFKMEYRADGYGVQGNQGGMGDVVESRSRMKLLKEINIYSAVDKIKNTTPTPIKKIIFDFDYSQCIGVHNNDNYDYDETKDDVQDPSGFLNQGGKLTLRGIKIRHGNSLKGELTPYKFTYSEVRDADGTPLAEKANPNYNLKGYNRWGGYKKNLAESNCGSITTGALSTSEFPYVEQGVIVYGDDEYDATTPDRTQADFYAAAWTLTTIGLPSGGQINVKHEADDIAFVQDKRAMQMFKVIGVTEEPPVIDDLSSLSTKLYEAVGANYNYLIVELAKPYTGSSFAKDFLMDKKNGISTVMDHMYFKFLMNLHKSNKSEKAYEYVPGYVKIAKDIVNGDPIAGMINSTHAFIRLEEVTIQDAVPLGVKVNPIVQASWNYTKLYLPRLAYNQSDPAGDAVLQLFESMISVFESIKDLAVGYNKSARLATYSQSFISGKSWVRLYNPDNSKDGGGSRVAEIRLTDEWTTLTGEASYTDAEYGQEYDYTTVDEYGNTISSGVAANEPMLGGEENPLRQPVFVEVEKLLAPNSDYYLETPFGESFYPGSSVGYSKVTVRNLQYTNVKRNATGEVVHEFYTAKDFPVITKETPLDPVRKKPNPLFKLLKLKSRDYMTTSQGYVIEINDMHGKPKAQFVYAENKEKPISGAEYFYKQKSAKRLDNKVLIMDKSGTIESKTVGVDYDFVVDMREQKTRSIGSGIGGNLDAFFALLAVSLPMTLPKYSDEETRYRSAVTTKVINRYGLLERTKATDLGSEVSTKNLMYDNETGEVLLTETANQFDDPVYNFTYPAHWGYDRMGPAYKNQGLVVSASVATSNPAQFFALGDEVIAGSQKGWVIQTNGGLVIQNSSGTVITPSEFTSLEVLRSGRRNQQSTSIGTVTSLKNPLVDTDNNGSPDKLIFDKVLNAGSVEFSDEWDLFCSCGINPGEVHNPYYRGTRGTWRAKKSYLHLAEREQSRLNNNTSIRTDGVYTSFNPFWLSPITAGADWRTDLNNWTYTSEVTIYGPDGNERENKDALDRYSAAIYGYNNSLPVAVASNSQYQEVAFDGFEDYDFCDCEDDHFSYEAEAPTITEQESHTGRRSIVVGAGGSIEITKIIVPCE